MRPEHGFQLQKLARQLRNQHERIAELVRSKRGSEAVTEAILTGHALSQAKLAVGRGWLAWLGDYCPAISPGTAKRYMRLATRAHMIDLRSPCDGLQQAYKSAGIVKV